MLVAEDKDLCKRFRSFFRPLNCNIVNYVNPLKALDNLIEVSPDILVYSTTDFPRHWKIFIKNIREYHDKKTKVIILAVSDDFSIDEADKAAYLGANLLYPERLETFDDFQGLLEGINRYKALTKQLETPQWTPEDDEQIPFIFEHPKDIRMVPGKLIRISLSDAIFHPDVLDDVHDLLPGMIIESGSLRLGDNILKIKCRIIRNFGSLTLSFVDFANDGFQTLMYEIVKHFETV